MSGIAYAFGYDSLLKSMKGGAGKYYNVPNFKDYAKGKKSELKDGYISSSVRLHSGYGRPEYSRSPTGDRYGRTGKDSYGYIKGSGTAGLYIYKDPNFQKAAPKKPAAAAPKPARKRQKNLPTKAKAVKFDTSKYDKQIKSLSGSLKSLQNKLLSNQSKYSKSLKSQQTNFESLFAKQNKKYQDSAAAQAALMKEQTQKYDENMSSLRSSIAETMSSSQQPAVGVKTGAYGKQSAALQRQGVRGSFGRTGLRIKKGIQDKSLNI